jgi:hypothetical protein
MRATPIYAMAIGVGLAMATSASAQNQNPPGVNPQHYECYGVKPQASTVRKVVLQDQFGKWETVTATATALCTPVSKNGGTVQDERTHLVCYTIRPGKAVAKRVEVVNQFGTEVLAVGVARTLCLPSLKKVVG